MAVLDDIGQEKQRISERLARLDADREKLVSQLAELEAAERVLSRLGRPARTAERRPGRMARAATAAEKPKAAPRRSRGRTGAAAAGQQPSITDVALRVVQRHREGISASDLLKQLSSEGLTVRPNHLGVALQRHKRAGRLEQRGQLWYPTREPEAANESTGP